LEREVDARYRADGRDLWLGLGYGLVFFFQAEDGIRDGHVTGVQTCALPISSVVRRLDSFLDLPVEKGLAEREKRADQLLAWDDEIGRASCRERVEISEGVGGFQEKL